MIIKSIFCLKSCCNKFVEPEHSCLVCSEYNFSLYRKVLYVIKFSCDMFAIHYKLLLKYVNFRSPFNPDIFIKALLCNMNIIFIFHFSWVVTVTFFRYLATMFKNILWECNKPPPPIKEITTLRRYACTSQIKSRAY